MIINCDPSNLFLTATQAIKPSSRVLDIGSGIHPSINLPTPIHICCEPYEEYVDVLKAQFPHLVVFNMGWAEVVKYVPSKSMDTVLLIDIIEHLEKDTAKDLLLKTLPLAKQQVVIFTPLGFFEQAHEDNLDAWGYHGGYWQTHRSGWVPEDFPNVDGGSWDFYICPDFHPVNNKGQVLNPPKGAFWAIWNAH